MAVDDAELVSEQNYFDHALEALEQMLETRRGALTQAVNRAELQAAQYAYEQSVRDTAPAFERGAAFGRIDLDSGETFYIGDCGIQKDAEPVVVHWKAPLATRFYQATHDDPQEVARKRQFKCDANQIQSFDDLVFAELIERVKELESPSPEELDQITSVDDALLSDLARHRTGEMRDIVQTIQAAQHRVISAGLDQLLVIQGGPGTGKTAVGLHRVSWLLFNHADRLGPKSVLVVGPNQTFVRYIAKVLPGLGDDQVVQRSITGLGPANLRLGRVEEPEVVRLKGERRMERLIEAALGQRIVVPVDGQDDRTGDDFIEVRFQGRTTRVRHDAVVAQVDPLRKRQYWQGRNEFRVIASSLLEGRVAEGSLAEAVDALVERVWPSLTAQRFVQELLGSERRLLRAAGSDFSAEEVQLLYRRAAARITEEQWSIADVALLDFADHLLTGTPTRFEHIVIDEAQDLSPMQLASVRRRSPSGSMTILGDIAQSTGIWARDDWQEVVKALAINLPVERAELEVGYRVTKEIFEFAAQLLPAIAPGVSPPRVVRSGPPPDLRQVEEWGALPPMVVAAAREHAGRGFSVAVVCPRELRLEVENAFAAEGVDWGDALTTLAKSITFVDPANAKGLEFDSVVVVEPEMIIDADPRGGRLLYVALTRATSALTVVHHGSAMPDPNRAPSLPPGDDETAEDEADPGGAARSGDEDPLPDGSVIPGGRLTKSIAESLAGEIKAVVQPDQYEQILTLLMDELLDRDVPE